MICSFQPPPQKPAPPPQAIYDTVDPTAAESEQLAYDTVDPTPAPVPIAAPAEGGA